MILYLDVSCLNRPFDDQSQPRIRLEAEAVTLIFEMIDRGEARLVSGEIAQIELDAIPDAERRLRVTALLPPDSDIIPLSQTILDRAAALVRMRFKAADAAHVASAEALRADALLTCDDRLQRLANRHAARLNVRIANPLAWIEEHRRETNAQ